MTYQVDISSVADAEADQVYLWLSQSASQAKAAQWYSWICDRLKRWDRPLMLTVSKSEWISILFALECRDRAIKNQFEITSSVPFSGLRTGRP